MAIKAEVFDDVVVHIVGDELHVQQHPWRDVALSADQVKKVIGFAIRAGLFERPEVSA